MIRNVRLLKEELKYRRRLNLLTFVIIALVIISFSKILLVIPAAILFLTIPASIVYGVKDGIKCVIHYSRLYLWDYLFYNNYLRIKEIKQELEN